MYGYFQTNANLPYLSLIKLEWFGIALNTLVTRGVFFYDFTVIKLKLLQG